MYLTVSNISISRAGQLLPTLRSLFLVRGLKGSSNLSQRELYSSNRQRPFFISHKNAGLQEFCPFSHEKMDTNSEKCIEYGK